MLLSLASAIGTTGCAGANDDDDDGVDAYAGSHAGFSLWGEGTRHDPVLQDGTDGEDPVDECFIATAAEGTIDHPHVVQLRDFRDTTLRSSAPGRLVIKIYYTLSPPIAKWIARSERRRCLTRRLLVHPLARVVTTANLTDSR